MQLSSNAFSYNCGIPYTAHVQGMYKSTLKCPQCSNVGVKFDPYMYLSLNLPESKRRTLQVTALYVDGSQPPMQHAVDVPKIGELLLKLPCCDFWA